MAEGAAMSTMPLPPPPAGWSRVESPFHKGELDIQARLGVQEKMDRQGRRSVRESMPEQHRAFFQQIPFLLTGMVDTTGQPWASILVGRPGFASSPDPTHLRIASRPVPGDPIGAAIREGADIGLLGIELPTRRRNRLNGTIERVAPDGFMMRVGQSFGNCPQYIQTREHRFIDESGTKVARTVRASALDISAKAMIAAADTFFIASAHEDSEAGLSKGVDVSHRGGRPGFVRVDDDVTLTAPDFVGNFHFNTLGNLLLDPRAGLLFIDFDAGDLLYIAARTEIIWQGPEVKAFAGAERLVRFHVTEMLRLEAALPLRFSEPAYSPLLARTGDWSEAKRALEAETLRNTWRPFRIVAKQQESAQITSLLFEPADDHGIAPHRAGQYLPIRITPPGADKPVLRTYTISDAPNGRNYRLSVKREGAVSGFLHDAPIGSVVEALSPRGDFVFDEQSRRPAVLISAGVGITPMIAMLNSLLVNNGRTRFHNRIWFVHGARNSGDHAFAEYLRDLKTRHDSLALCTVYSRPAQEDRPGVSHHAEGRIDIDLLKELLPLDDYDFYLCGPAAFMQDLYDGLRAINIADDRIHLEAFGPASVRRNRPAASAAAPALVQDAADEPVEVTFAASGKTVAWTPAAGTLLELAEAQGLSPPYSCRAGLCGTCAVPVLAGAVEYRDEINAEVAPGAALICCAIPKPGIHIEGSSAREGVSLDL
jgi:ferredoxin-NADP reductase/predicted pyridoxine 5'-phosphate oxidase superfamily flavin-nucleotide-binding protein